MTLTLTIPARSVVIMSHPENGQEIARFVVLTDSELQFEGYGVCTDPLTSHRISTQSITTQSLSKGDNDGAPDDDVEATPGPRSRTGAGEEGSVNA